MSVRVEQPGRVHDETSAVCPGCAQPVEDARCHFCGVAARAGRYAVVRVVAQTAHSRVYEARGPGGEKVALKELQFNAVPDAATIEAFEREVATLAALQHPAVPRFVESFREGQGVGLRLYLAAEFIEGRALAERLRDGPLPESEVFDLAEQALAVLAYLHAQTPVVLHRDLKPQNLIIDPAGRLHLVDFGSTRRLDKEQTHGSTLVGTFGYMAPEQLGGTVDKTTDLYGLGATFLHAATGVAPGDLLQADLTPRLPGTLSAGLRTFLARLLQPRRDRRYATAGEAQLALQSLRSGRIPGARARRFAVAAAVLVAVVTGTSLVMRPSPTRPEAAHVELALDAMTTKALIDELRGMRSGPFIEPVITAQGKPLFDALQQRPDAMTTLISLVRDPTLGAMALELLGYSGYQYQVSFPAADQLALVDLMVSPDALTSARARAILSRVSLTEEAWRGVRRRLEDRTLPIQHRAVLAAESPSWAAGAMKEQQQLLRATGLALLKTETELPMLFGAVGMVTAFSTGEQERRETITALIEASARTEDVAAARRLGALVAAQHPVADEVELLRHLGGRDEASKAFLEAATATPPEAKRAAPLDRRALEHTAREGGEVDQCMALGHLLELDASDPKARASHEEKLLKLAQSDQRYVFQAAVGALGNNPPLSRAALLALMPQTPRFTSSLYLFAEQYAALGAEAAPALPALRTCVTTLGNPELRLKCQLAVEAIERSH